MELETELGHKSLAQKSVFSVCCFASMRWIFSQWETLESVPYSAAETHRGAAGISVKKVNQKHALFRSG